MFTALVNYSFITYNANVEKKLIMLKMKVPTLWYKENNKRHILPINFVYSNNFKKNKFKFPPWKFMATHPMGLKPTTSPSTMFLQGEEVPSEIEPSVSLRP